MISSHWAAGGVRLGPASLVRAVGRVIRSVVGGDSEDSHQHPVSFCHQRKDIPPQHHIMEEPSESHCCHCTNAMTLSVPSARLLSAHVMVHAHHVLSKKRAVHDPPSSMLSNSAVTLTLLLMLLPVCTLRNN